MADYITSNNLDDVIKENKKIRSEVDSFRKDFIRNYNELGIIGGEKLAFEFLKKNYIFLQIPIPNKYYGGAIIVKDNFKIPLINTNRSRVQQYFVAWHEIYHLLYDRTIINHVIPAEEMEINERKADYFAAKMLLGDVYKYFYSLGDDTFLNKIAKCIDVFKVPYKAILIELYEEASEVYNDLKLMNLIKENFDKNSNDLITVFNELELDTELLNASNIISFGGIDKKIESISEKEFDVNYHKDNLKFLKQLKEQIKEIMQNNE